MALYFVGVGGGSVIPPFNGNDPRKIDREIGIRFNRSVHFHIDSLIGRRRGNMDTGTLIGNKQTSRLCSSLNC